MVNLVDVNSKNKDKIHQLYPGDEGKYWVNFNWYWVGISARQPLIRAQLIFAENNSRPIGFASYGQHFKDRLLKEAASETYELYHMVIDSSKQGCGLGRASTIQILQQMAKNSDCKKLVVACHPDNKVATSLYLSLEFEEIGKNYDDDPLYSLDPEKILQYSSNKKNEDGFLDNDGTNEAWEYESRKSESDFKWSDWELGLDT